MAKKGGLIIDVLAEPDDAGGSDEGALGSEGAPPPRNDAESVIQGIEAQLAELRRMVAELG